MQHDLEALIARLQTENERLRTALGYFLTDERFHIFVCGNPIEVERMLADARAALKETTDAA